MTRKQELFWGAGILALGIAAVFIFRRTVNTIVREGGAASWLPDITIPDFNIGDFIIPRREGVRYGGFFPCDCGCGNGEVSGDTLLPGLSDALKDMYEGDASSALGQDPYTAGPMLYFSEIPNGRRAAF